MTAQAEVLVDEGLPDGFAEYVGARGAALQRFAHLVTGGAADSADLVQDALERAYPRWRGLVRRGTHDAYVRRSIVNGSVSRWRKQRRLVSVGDIEPYDAAVAAAPAVLDAAEAWQLCGELPPAQRAAVILRFHEDLSFAEIARILDCAEATARSHVHRALATLRTRLAVGDDDD
ncbi:MULTISPECIES: SigE family RNA polymerase sigma factor [unclassified Nocardioides]|uniref:SigE family RNA polymerase sigma factor n=1 Tax=unclassified Nocardioides TaxID=2615069 RepID=UPI0006FC5D8C|nr:MULTISPECIES: SigE family RNA polymerase sigma factor [unclassified Nocardioides]KRA31438.1 hypothetical protein ASD81_18565 [Nocardioides sp. Root614]KRA88058.1 hypothetical protein ASD84_18840 [Nocardioides sp. Root682]